MIGTKDTTHNAKDPLNKSNNNSTYVDENNTLEYYFEINGGVSACLPDIDGMGGVVVNLVGTHHAFETCHTYKYDES